MPSVISNLKAKINDLKTRVAQNSISPNFVGGILDEIVDTSTAADEAAAAQSTADRALAAATVNSDRLDLYADDINNLQNDVSSNATDIRVNTEALTVLNRRGQVESFAAVLTSDPDDDPIPEELAGKRVWSTQFNKFLEINIVGDPPYQTPEDSAAVVDKFYVCDGRLYLGVKVSQTATTLKPLFDSEIEQLSRTHSISLTAVDNGTLSWSGADHNKIRNGDIVEWENMGVPFRGTVISRTSSSSYDTLAVVYDFDGDEPLELHVLWINSNGTATDACFSSDQTLASAFNAKQTKLEDTTDVVIESETNTTDGLYLTDSAKRAVFVDMWLSIGGEKLANGKYRMTDSGKELTFAEALVRYNRNGFIDQWNEAAGPYGHYNEETGFFELNGLTDITYEEAMRILVDSVIRTTNCIDLYYKKDIRTRTLIPTILCGHFVFAENCDSMYARCYTLTVIQLAAGDKTDPCPANIKSMFYYCSSLKEISGILDLYNITAERTVSDAFSGCTKLESVKIKRLNISISFSSCKNLSFTSLQFMVTNAANSAAITITVHPDVYAKLTGDTTNPAVAALTPTELAQWQQILTAATAKNISFTTP